MPLVPRSPGFHCSDSEWKQDYFTINTCSRNCRQEKQINTWLLTGTIWELRRILPCNDTEGRREGGAN